MRQPYLTSDGTTWLCYDIEQDKVMQSLVLFAMDRLEHSRR
jgi:hypothetical protein